MTKTLSVVMLPTEKATSLHIIRNGSLVTVPTGESPNTGQHLYIISDDEIKEGDWFVDTDNTICQSKTPLYAKIANGKECKKIVATTDKSIQIRVKQYFIGEDYDKELELFDLPQIPESFTRAYIKAYNEGKPITEVDLEIVIGQGNEDGQTTSIKEHIKTRPDNTVIVHQSKMYSKNELVAYVGNALNAITKELGVKYPQGFLTQWIQDNLK